MGSIPTTPVFYVKHGINNHKFCINSGSLMVKQLAHNELIVGSILPRRILDRWQSGLMR